MSRYTREEMDDLAAGYALGATSAEEREAVEQMIATSTDFAADVRAYHEIAVHLAEQRAVAPAEAVRARFLAAIHEAPTAARAAEPVAGITPVTPLRRRPVPVWMVLGLAASFLAIASLYYENMRLRRSFEANDVQLTATRLLLVKQTATLNSVLDGEKDLYVVRMVSADTANGPGMQFFWNAREQKGFAHAFRLAPAPVGKAYQLWLIRNGKPESVKVFNSGTDGRALVSELTLPASVVGVTQVLLTLEPAGGSALPTSTPFVGGTLSTS